MKSYSIIIIMLFLPLINALTIGEADNIQGVNIKPEPSNIVINLNESLFNVNNSDTVDNYHASAFQKLAENNIITGSDNYGNYQMNESGLIYHDTIYTETDLNVIRHDLTNRYFGDNAINTYYYGANIFLKDVFQFGNAGNYFLKPIDSNITAQKFIGNGSLLTGVCLANGTNCPVASSGSSNLTNVAWRNETNVFTKQQVIALDNNYKLNISYENGTTQVTSYSNAGGTGDRTATITLSTTFSTSGNTIKLLNGNTADSDPYFSSDATPQGKYLRFDFGTGVSKLITGFKWYQDLSLIHI